MKDRTCVVCGSTYQPTSGGQKTCGPECSRQRRNQKSSESVRRHYVVRSIRSPSLCGACGAEIPAPRTGQLRIWCRACRAAGEDVRMRKRLRPDARPCHKCGTPVAGRKGIPGVTVCDECRVEKNRHRAATHEHQRRLRKYGLTETEYGAILDRQGGRCPGCLTDDPGVKGWCIDHCHETGRVRALLCNRCNTTIGLCDENPATLRRLADLVASFNQLLAV